MDFAKRMDVMKIEAGRYYRTRDGRKFGPVKPSRETHPWLIDLKSYEADGKRWEGAKAPETDLIAEWSEPMDLTKITSAFGLLDAETQAALKANGGPLELYMGAKGWDEVYLPTWTYTSIYRVKPSPPKPNQLWVRNGVTHTAHLTDDLVEWRSNGYTLYREVVPD
jgi:hypothetical protein